MSWIILIYAGGIALILSEMFLPGLIVGSVGVLLVIASCAMTFQHYPEQALPLILAEILGAVVLPLIGMVLFMKSPFSRGFVLKATQEKSKGWVSNETPTELMGKTGNVYTALRPAGAIVIEGERYDAVSSGSFIDKGITVRVVEVQGNRVVVEPADQL